MPRSLAAAEQLLAELRAADLSEVDSAALAAELVELRGLADSLEAEWLRRLEAFDRRGGAAEAGAVSTGAWVRSACRLSPRVARDRVELARSLPRWPNTTGALAAGDISPAHARQVVAAVEDLAEAAGPEVAAEAEPALVEVATRVDPACLRRELARVRHVLAPDAALAAAETSHAQRRLSVSETFEGMVAVDGMLDPEGGALLLSALMPLATRSGPHDGRTPRQRRADALVELCRRQLDTGDLPTIAGERPHLSVVVNLDTLQYRSSTAAEGAGVSPPTRGLTADASLPSGATADDVEQPSGAVADGMAGGVGMRPPAGSAARSQREVAGPGGQPVGSGQAGSASARPPRPPRLPLLGPPAAETEWAGPLCGEAARRLACDAAISRVITNGASQPLDVGRRTRTISPAIRTALVVRDRGCAFPGCDRPSGWTDAHHLQHWANGGPTALENLVLLCRRHHRTVHEGGWRLTRTPDHRWTAHPPGQPGPRPPVAAGHPADGSSRSARRDGDRVRAGIGHRDVETARPDGSGNQILVTAPM